MEPYMKRGEDFFRTGTFIREDDYREILELTELAKRIPVKRIEGHEEAGLHSTLARQAWWEIQCKTHGIAIRMGLPDLPSGKYGLAENGEFILSEDADVGTKAKREAAPPPPDFKMDEITASDVERISKMPDHGEANEFNVRRPVSLE